jgi:hypothetical protein
MAENEFKKTPSSSASSVKWLLVGGMLVVLAVWVYKGDDVAYYGEAALAKTQGAGSWLSGLGDKARHVYQCAANNATPVATPPVAAPVNKPALTVNGGVAPCCPACPPCAATPPYMDFGSMYGRNGSAPAASAEAPVATPPELTASPAPSNANVDTVAVPSNYPAYAGMPQPVSPVVAAPPVPAVVPPVTMLAAPVMSKDLLRARNWVSHKKYDFAIIAYKKHIAANPNDVNGYGEIGNVYLLAKQYPQAANSFYEAANRLLDAGYIDEVLPMLPVIAQYQPELAVKLKSKITLMGK